MGAVWRSIEAWEHPVPDAAVAAARTRANLRRDTPWTEYARAPGGELALPPLPPLRDGLAASCADQRAWTIAALDDRGRADEHPHRALAGGARRHRALDARAG